MSGNFMERLAQSKTLDDTATVMEGRIKEYGFAGFVYWTHSKRPIEELTHDDAFILSRGPTFLKVFEALYLGKRLYLDDPVVQAATQRTQPFTTKEVRAENQRNTNRRQRMILALERKFGFNHDIYIPLHAPLRTQVFYAYFQGSDPTFEGTITSALPQLTLDAALFAASLADFVTIGSGNPFADFTFSVREQQCLTWVAKGRSNLEIAETLGISERTVKFHVKNVMDKLNADNRTQAVAIAARSGWVPN